MPKRKMAQIRAMLLVAILELEKLERVEAERPSKRRKRKPSEMHLVLIKGGKG